jgi:hypothetical protein
LEKVIKKSKWIIAAENEQEQVDRPASAQKFSSGNRGRKDV